MPIRRSGSNCDAQLGGIGQGRPRSRRRYRNCGSLAPIDLHLQPSSEPVPFREGAIGRGSLPASGRNGRHAVIDGAASNRLLLAIPGRTAADRNPFAVPFPSRPRNHRRLTLAALCTIKESRRCGNQFVSVRSRYPTPSITNAGVPTAPALTAAMISASFSPRYIGLAVMLLWP